MAFQPDIPTDMSFYDLNPSNQRQCIYTAISTGRRCTWNCLGADNERAIKLHGEIIAASSGIVSLDLLKEYILCVCCRSGRARHQDRIQYVKYLEPLAERWQQEILERAGKADKEVNIVPDNASTDGETLYTNNSAISDSVPAQSIIRYTSLGGKEGRYERLTQRPYDLRLRHEAASPEFVPHINEPHLYETSVAFNLLSCLVDEYDFRDGSLYIFDRSSSPGYVKIGWTSRNVQGRLDEWSKCGYTPNLLFSVHDVPNADRAKTLTHHELIMELRRERICKATHCRKSHEWFEISPESAEKVVSEWAEFMKRARPYDSTGELKSEWRDAVQDMTNRGEAVTARKLLDRYEASVAQYTDLTRRSGAIGINARLSPSETVLRAEDAIETRLVEQMAALGVEPLRSRLVKAEVKRLPSSHFRFNFQWPVPDGGCDVKPDVLGGKQTREALGRASTQFDTIEEDLKSADDNNSIFPLSESISSKSSIRGVLGSTGELVALLIENTHLQNLYPTLFQTYEFGDFRLELRRLLRNFSEDLSKEASTPIEVECARFVSQQRRRVSHAIGQEVFGWKEQSLFGSVNQRQNVDSRDRIERHLREVTASKGGTGEARQHEQVLDDESSEDEKEPRSFFNLNRVENFLLQSRAFMRLRNSIKELTLKVEVSSMEEKNATVREVNRTNDCSIGDTTDVEILSVTAPSLDKPTMAQRFHWSILKRSRPTVTVGHRRLEWKCDCGTPLYGDFHGDPDEIDKLAMEIGANGYGIPKSVREAKQVLTGSGEPKSNAASQAQALPASNEAQSSSASSNTYATCQGTGAVPDPTVSNIATNRLLPLPPLTPKRFVALCINTGEFDMTLGEVDISSITTDRQMFQALKSTYHSRRGFRTKAFRRWLIKPVDIKFIQFAVEDSHRVDPIPDPPDCTLCASDIVVRFRRYEPHLHSSTNRAHPPISANSFLHYWQCHSDERSLQKPKWLNRLPKKLDQSLEEMRRTTPTDDDVLGWGILVVEGLNKKFVTWMTLFMMLLGGAISIWYSIWQNDVSSGFAMGAYIVGLWAALITALYFQWQTE